MVYLDYNASTPLAPAALDAMLPYLSGHYGNPSSIHTAGREARAGIDDARERFAALLRVRPHEIIFTGGGTEACNLAIFGIARAHAPKGRHIITVATEHHAVLHACEYLHHFEGYELTVLPVDRAGRVDPEELRKAIRPQTTLVTVMHANNETGTLQPMAELAAICRENGVFFHTDAIQSFGKLPLNPRELGADAVSFAGHKFYGPKGVGAVYLRAGIATTRAVHGGAQENSRRPGTENAAAIVGMVTAAEEVVPKGIADQDRQAGLRDALWTGIQEIEPRATRNSPETEVLANTLNVSFPESNGESLIIGLDIEGVGVSSGSACMVGSVQPSHVLRAMRIDGTPASSAIRFSLGLQTTEEDIAHCLRALATVLSRQTSPLAA